MADIGPLQAYLQTRNSNMDFNEQSGVRELQKAGTLMQILQHVQQQKQQQTLMQALQSGDERALMSIPGGIDILAKKQALQNGQTTNELNLSRIAEAQRKTQLENGQARAADTLANYVSTPQFKPTGDQAPNGPGAVFGGDAQAIEAMKQAEATGTPFRGYVNNPAIAQGLAIKADPARAIPELLKQQAPPPVVTPYQTQSLAMRQKEIDARPPPQEPMLPVQQADGSVIYVPRSEAGGRSVGGRPNSPNLTRNVQALGTAFEKANLPQTVAVLNQAEKITPELATYVTGVKAYLPDNMVPKEAALARQDIAKLFNITLKDRSGAAVTNQEMERLKQEFGKGLFRTPEQLIAAIGKAKKIVEAHYKGIAAGFGKPTLDAYNENISAIGGTPVNFGDAPSSNIDALLDKYK